MPPLGMKRRTALSALLAFAVSLGCAQLPAPQWEAAFAYFSAPAPDDPWSQKIAGWQSRERADQAPEALAPASVSGPGENVPAAPGDLREKYAAFRRDQKRALARQIAAWVQENARGHYRPDGAVDHWATLEETLVHDGDDCDGLELLAFNLLHDLGFSDDEVFRAIVYREADGQHHMVTLWFEAPDDPWVIDPTGAMTRGMPHMSELPGWTPLKVFSRTREFTPQPVAVNP